MILKNILFTITKKYLKINNMKVSLLFIRIQFFKKGYTYTFSLERVYF